MIIPEEFNEIRPYTPEELPQVFEELIANPAFGQVMSVVMPGVPMEAIAAKLRQCKTNLEVQKAFCYGLVHQVLQKYSDGFSFDSSELPEKQRNYTFISNHRDIILDSGILSVALIDAGFSTTVEIAIGDNLLIYPWIKKLVRINKSFIVQRGLSMRQILESSMRMSRYIHFAVNEKQENVWIAQREGRAKDSNDRTQESVLKMLAMGGEGDIIDRLQHLNIVPLSLSYEYDPCDFLKAAELQMKRDVEGFKKSQEDDLNNMKTGLFGYKGRIHFAAAACLNNELESLRACSKNELFPRLTQLIDKKIHSHYHLFPCNYIACDQLEGGQRFSAFYTQADVEKFNHYLQQKLDMITIPNKDEDFLRTAMLKMYANPTYNYLEAVDKNV